MRLLHILLLPLCLLFAQVGPGAGSFSSFIAWETNEKCVKQGGYCNYSQCQYPSKQIDYCYRKKANCCRNERPKG
ncbi:Beta-defensin 1 [Myotis brandtii]|uniref:Beta-defensin 1 n=1 Tax=Myotis brandtii TaxID=109478 RepID=S7PYZ6_MYOBR|nr:Beta-defensin 1 [Myotis brandtii]